MSSRSLKFVFYSLVAHGVLFLLMKLDQGGAYGIGSAFGRGIWIGIAIYAVRRLAKHGWGVTLFIVVASLFQEATALSKTLAAMPPGDSGSAVAWVLFTLVNLPLAAAFIFLLPESSRAPFKAKLAQSSAPQQAEP